MGFYLKYTVMCGLCEEYLHAAYAFCKTTQRDLRERVKIDRLPLQMEFSLFFFPFSSLCFCQVTWISEC